MADKDGTTNAFFEHLRKDQPTRFGTRLMRLSSERILAFADVAPGSRVLEIGPGRGEFANLCLARKMDYYAVEPNPELAASLKDRGAKVVCARVPPLPDLDVKFDLVAMINVMEHMSSMEQALQISIQVRKVLQPRGKFLVHSPDFLNWRLHFFNCDFSHNYVTTRRRLDQLLVNAGYEDVRSCYMSSLFRGGLCFLTSAVASRLPFGVLDSWFPNNRLVNKLYKLQMTFSRLVVILGRNVG